MPYALLILLGLWLPLTVHSQVNAPAISHTPIESTRFEPVPDEVLAEHWQLDVKDIAKYRRYMTLEGRYFYAHLDPIMVLGIIETDLGKRREYADKYLQAERHRVSEQISFATLVAARSLLLYGPESLFDFSALPQAANSPGFQRAGTERQARELAATGHDQRVALNSSTPQSLTLNAGDTVELLVTPECLAPCYALLDQVLVTDGVHVAIYGRGFADTDALIVWFENWQVERLTDHTQRARIQLKHFDPVIFSGFDSAPPPPPLALVRRAGRVLGAL